MNATLTETQKAAVNALNDHDTLTAQVKELREALGNMVQMHDFMGFDVPDSTWHPKIQKTLDAARRALSSAGKEAV